MDKVLVKSISRFARNTKDCLETIRELKSIGVGVYFEEQNIDTSGMTGELLTAVFASIAQKESERLSAKMRWSYQYRMKSGTFLPSSVPFGYVLQDGKIAVDEERANLVQRIFSDYLAGRSMEEIAGWLNEENVPVRIGWANRKWDRNAISYILSNERYIGNSLWQKTYATDNLPTRYIRNHGERAQYYAERTHPPIIALETFQAAQALRKRRRDKCISDAQRQKSPLQMKMYCGVCGTVFKRHKCGETTYWVCRTRFSSKDDCPVPQISEDEIHAAFLRMYHKL